MALEGNKGINDVSISETKSDAKKGKKQSSVNSEVIGLSGSIDPTLTTRDMLALLHGQIKENGPAGQHIDSMNTFYEVGVKQIATKLFTAEERMPNDRNKTEEDLEIAEIEFKVDIKDVEIGPPVVTKYGTNVEQMNTPNFSRVNGLTYSGDMFVSANITARAHLKNGKTRERVDEVKKHKIAEIPIMIRSKFCNTYGMPKEALKRIEEDPSDPGGIFVVNGTEWAVEMLENITMNMFHVYKNMYNNEICRGTFISKPGDAFENSHQLLVRYLQSGAITIDMTTEPLKDLQVPFFIMLRLLGMSSQRDMTDHIVHGINSTDTVSLHMMRILEKSFDVAGKQFESIAGETDPTAIVNHIAKLVNEAAATPNAAKDDDVQRYINLRTFNMIDKYLLPHIGITAADRIRKARYLTHLIHKLLRVEYEVLESTDRDSYKNKRLHPAGISFSKAFKTDFNMVVIQPIKQALSKQFKNFPFSKVNLAEAVKSAIKPKDLEQLLVQSITSGDKTITVKRTEVINRMASQQVYRKNNGNLISVLNTITTPNTSAGNKQTERADAMRRVHPTYLGVIDVTQSADTGEKVGVNKQKACTAVITGASNSYALKKTLLDDSSVIPLENVAPSDITKRKLAKVFVNGDWIGCCEKAHELARRYRMLRREGKIDPWISIVWEPLIREVGFWCDAGRIIRPLVIVYNNIEEYMTAWRNKDMSVEFKQWIKFDKAVAEKLRRGEVTMRDLRDQGYIEYISAEEQENALLARNINVLRKHQNDVTYQFTHCDIDQAIVGMMTLAAPLANHSNAVRNTYYTNHRKQSTGWFALNWPYRIDKNTFLQYYCETPIVRTFSDNFTYPNGTNCIVALCIYDAFNQEDSTDGNQTSIDRGMMNGSRFNFERTELAEKERFGNPDFARTMDIKRDASYEKIENGVIKEGSVVVKGDVLIVKTLQLQKPADKDKSIYVDRSIVYKYEQPAYVDRVIISRNADDIQMCKVKLRESRPLIVGDKVASRTGNKGIVGKLMPAMDMLYDEDGMSPDLIVNAHSIPTRMAVNQILECAMATIAIHEGVIVDGTQFIEQDIDGMMEKLAKYGLKFGYKRLYNGRTGDAIDTLTFVGPTTYQRLMKFVIDDAYVVRNAPNNPLTHQPLEGKQQDGGLRLGEMEKDCILVNGKARGLAQKFYRDSDGFTDYICRNCNDAAIVNEERGLYMCKRCGDNADPVRNPTSYVATVFRHEANAMGVGMRKHVVPYEFRRN
ncbi:DNA-directed RNA polymerase beta subunit [Faustovirus]|nr:DNA-directed RNA polymerase beta subunit [Faustovirus]AMN84950.1 DNA-directed RNA polymerase beta subunit [Faustovirus]